MNDDASTSVTVTPPYLELSREFGAPVAAVWRATVDPELVVRWLGPARNTTRVERWEMRTGGSYRYLQITPDGIEQAFRGVVHRIVEERSRVQTFEWEGAPDQVALEYTSFDDLRDRTRLRTRTVFPSTEALEQALINGMEAGIRESLERLARVAREI
ncbi:SRPBCC domain-containing protein [Gryllotalpicola ginsengisoli]|uniref:SRPBCC domain-containing protein n=1 Tax=Gryllotalpicola ginsengisoli TaxID=444608 RepID=UPI0003B79985|nr:SRPBCC domain-containing protein [Gryllotalpicola ginsengisoli]